MLCYSTLGLPDLGLPDLAARVRYYGFEGLEIALTPEQCARRGDRPFWHSAREGMRAHGVRATVIHLGNPRLRSGDPEGAPTLLHPEASARRRWMDLIGAAFEIAERIGATHAAVASGPAQASDSPAALWARLTETLKAALELRPEGVGLLIEHEPEHFIRTAADLAELGERLAGKVEINLDVGHLQVVGDPIGPTVRALGSRIRNVHLEDIRDRVHRHLLPGEGDIDFQEVAEALSAIGYEGYLTADLYPYADQASVALERAREVFGPLWGPGAAATVRADPRREGIGSTAELLERLRAELRAGLDEPMLLRALDRILAHFGCQVGTIHDLSPEGDRLRMRAQRGVPEAILPQVRTIPIGKGMAGLAAERRAPVQVCNLQTDESGVAKPGARLTRMEGAISLPLLARGQLRGTLGVAKAVAYEFTAEETESLLSIGSLLAEVFERETRRPGV